MPFDRNDECASDSTRTLSSASFLFRDSQLRSGPADAAALHIVSAGNFPRLLGNGQPDPNDLRLVTAPGAAKNVITVGSTETYNQQWETPGCPANNADNADNPRQVTGFTRTGFSNQRLKPDLVAPGTRMIGWRSVENGACGSPCKTDVDGQTNTYFGTWGTSYSAPVVAGAAAITREWLRTLGFNPASPALVKAALISAARSLTNRPTCSSGCGTCCSDCGDVRPAPDKYQGWGGVALDRFFRASTNYFMYDQDTTFTSSQQQPFTRTLTISDVTKDINIALVWTDRYGPEVGAAYENLQNDLDLTAAITSGGTYSWYGNNFYTSIDSCSRNGFSLRNPSPVVPDRKNNVEKISIKASDIPSGATQVTIHVTPFSIEGDAIDPAQNSTFRQDFALFVENARL